ncbi:DUF4386 domain-containing protein [Streptomyces sp. NBC_00829]|uniref:DUF4386 domain-containing protein n=1 Tax=Streptomyces sp. NBC_00829 TaxID=2903679 RepID=UPI003866E602|nr:DUF4386 domain-containing protein [Streptomyces sp. NBC_00829]
MDSARKTAVVAGGLFLVTEMAAMGALALYGPALDSAAYITGSGADGRVFLGALCELVLAVAVVGTGVTLFPVLKRRNEGMALGYVCGRLLEAAVIVVGIISVLSVVSLRQDAAQAQGADATSAATVAKSLGAVHDWSFLFGPDLVLGVNTLLLAHLMYRSGLVPRPIAVLGLVGGTLICASGIAVMFGLYPQLSVWGSVAAVPVFAWEVALAVRLIARGFGPASVGVSRRNDEWWAAAGEGA